MISPQRGRRSTAFAAAALVLAAILLFAGLGDHVFWSDEANTALYARNLLAFGELTAWDGANLIGFSGKAEFNGDLRNTYMPPQQYYVAALGMKLFGPSPFGARLPFALFGLMTIALTAWWARRFFGTALPLFLPVLLLALSPAFLLFMRNCRYYALAAFWMTALFALWTAFATQRFDSRTRLRTLAMHLLGAVTVAGFFTCQYLTAAAAIAVLPVFFLDPRFRSRRQFLFLATLAAAGFCGVLWVLARGSAAENLFEQRGSGISWLGHAATLFWWHLRDVGFFELFAWPIALPLALPWIIGTLQPARPLAARGLLLLALFVAFLAVVATFSPQGLGDTRTADIRYAVPLIGVGVLIAGVSLLILYRMHRAIALAVAFLLIGTNALHLGSHRHQHRHRIDGAFPVRSTLLDYLRELADPYESTNARVSDAIAGFPEGTRVWINPFPLTTSSMFDLPHLRFCAQARDKLKENHPRIASLPEYVFWSCPLPDVLVIVADEVIIKDGGGFEIQGVNKYLWESVLRFIESDAYRSRAMVPIVMEYDDTRPEIPYRLFWEPPAAQAPEKVAWILQKEPKP